MRKTARLDDDEDTQVGLPGTGEILAGKYRILGVLGEGGMGVVVSAQHVYLGQLVAVKFLSPSTAREPEPIARFLREARALATLRSQHIVRVIDVDTLPSGAPFIVMEHLTGTDLGAIVEREGPLSPATAVDYVLQVCEALAEAHAAGIVHRDLKPSNMFLTKRPDGSSLVKILDFGVAKTLEKDLSHQLTTTGTAMGSPLYMSPEQIQSSKAVDERSDIWSLGVILHELASGKAPFDAPTIHALCARIVVEKPIPLRRHRPDAPRLLEEAILRCLEKDPARRFQDVGALAGALAGLVTFDARDTVERIRRTRGGVSTSLVSAAVPPASPTKVTPVWSGVQPPTGARTGMTTSASVSSDAPARRASSRSATLAIVASVALAAVVGVFFVVGRGASPAHPTPPGDSLAAPAVSPIPPAPRAVASAEPAPPPPESATASVEVAPASPTASISTAPKAPILKRRDAAPRSTAAPAPPKAPGLFEGRN